MSAESWALAWSQPWDATLDRLQQDLEQAERRLARGDVAGGDVALRDAAGTTPAPLPVVDGPLPAHLGDRARGLLARTDALAHRVAGELSRTGRELRDVTERAPEAATAARRGRKHPAFLDTRA